jgi:Predicted membrane protein involved in D-alanine export
MVFSSLSFVFFILPLFLLCDRLAMLQPLASARWVRNIPLLVLSLFFYTWGESATVLLLLGLSLLNYLAGMAVHRFSRPLPVLFGAVSVNLLVLFFYKYCHWFLTSIFPALAWDAPALPLGISFFTFHAISYLVDIYRKVIPPARNALDFFTYFCMFPHLVAGPIIRYSQIQNEIVATRKPSSDLFCFGMYRFLLGLNKKVLIANTIAPLADIAFNSTPANLTVLDAWIGAVAYTIQLYFDFSGYSDMAIGLAAMAGFRFEENFFRPYSAASVREFWRRWHISLSRWFVDYLFIPLGGSRASAFITYRNLLLVFVLCGLWHGADATFLLWGLWHGVFLVFERLYGGEKPVLPCAIRRLYTMAVVVLGWVLFRAETTESAFAFLAQMASGPFAVPLFAVHVVPLVALGVGVLLCALPDSLFPRPTAHTEETLPTLHFCVHALLAVISFGMLCLSSTNPFLYFNF